MKRKPKNATAMTPVKDLKTKDDVMAHYNAVLMEDIRHEMKAVIEKVDSSETSLRQTMEEIQEKNEKRFSAIEAAVTHHTGELAGIKADIVEVKSSIKQLDEKMTKRVNDHEERIVTIEKAVILT